MENSSKNIFLPHKYLRAVYSLRFLSMPQCKPENLEHCVIYNALIIVTILNTDKASF